MAEVQYKLDFDPKRKDVMVGRLADGRRMCVTVELFMEAMSWMEMSWLDDPEHWLGYEQEGQCWIEGEVASER